MLHLSDRVRALQIGSMIEVGRRHPLANIGRTLDFLTSSARHLTYRLVLFAWVHLHRL